MKHPEASPSDQSTGRSSAPQRACVLLVEDVIAERSRLDAMIKRHGYQAIVAADGVAALDILQTAPVDVILSDWIMPSMDGLTLCRTIQERWGDARPHFIMLTGRDQGADLVAGFNAGADDYIRKPVPNEELKARLHAGCRQVKLRRKLQDEINQLRAALQQASGHACSSQADA